MCVFKVKCDRREIPCDYTEPVLSGYKGKSVPLQAWRCPEGSRKLSFPDFATTAQNGGRLLPLRTGRLYPQEILLYSCLLEAESTPGPQCSQKDFMSMKNPLTSAGIEPTTFRIVAQHLNHCATAVPFIQICLM